MRQLEAARGYLLLEMPDQAFAALEKIANPALVAFDYHHLRGETLRSKQHYAEALPELEQAHQLRPKDLDVLMAMAWCYKRTDQLSRAIAAMNEAYQAHSDEPIVLYNLSCYYALAGNKTQALTWLARALRMAPHLRRLIAGESDFDPIRHDEDFLSLLAMTAPADDRG